ncbi:MAG: PEP-CTERM sorting domain-containing protein [Syntrophobacteraceae bacterium]
MYGDIYDNFLAGTLDNANGVPSYAPDDVSMALGWNCLLDPGSSATIQFLLTDLAPASGFYLSQTDAQNGDQLFIYSTQDIEGGGPVPVPEPGSMMLLGTGLVGLFARRRRSFPRYAGDRCIEEK